MTRRPTPTTGSLMAVGLPATSRREPAARTRRTTLPPQHSMPPRRARSRWLAGMLAFMAGAGLVVAAQRALNRDVALEPSAIVWRGLHVAQQAELDSYVEPFRGIIVQDMTLPKLAAAVEAHPWVHTASITRGVAGTVEIAVTEREAVAMVAVGHVYLVGADGAVFKRAEAVEALDLPVITGLAPDTLGTRDAPLLKRALAAIEAHTRRGKPGGALMEVRAIPGVGIRAHTEIGTEVDLGVGNYVAKWARFSQLVDIAHAHGRALATVDLHDGRLPERVAVRLRPRTEMGEDAGT